MREILFRGKRMDNGEWETGGIAPVWCDTSRESCFVIDKMTGYLIHVIPETVGQYTGLTDKSGKKIFEGDIVRNKSESFCTGQISEDIFAVEWWQFGCHFQLIRRFKGGESTAMLAQYGDYEVIGNIYDNPQLMR